MENKIKERVIHKVSEELKKRIVEEIESGKNSIAGASKDYQIPKGSIRNWLWDYGNYRTKSTVIEVIMKDEKETIKQLQAALAKAEMKNVLFEEVINMAGDLMKMDLKKNFGEQALKNISNTTPLQACATYLDINETTITDKKKKKK